LTTEKDTRSGYARAGLRLHAAADVQFVHLKRIDQMEDYRRKSSRRSLTRGAGAFSIFRPDLVRLLRGLP
jgi:hypothetical protein